MPLTNGFTGMGEFYQTIKELLPKLFKKLEYETSSSFYEISIIPTLKPDKGTTRKTR